MRSLLGGEMKWLYVVLRRDWFLVILRVHNLHVHFEV